MDGRSDIVPTQPKHCEICGTIFQRKRFQSGRLEGLGVFLRRRFCSLSCANSQSKGGGSRTRSHVRARQHLKQCCERCGSTQKLHVHHADENWKNNEQNNLQTLCESCHRSWHATQRARGVKPAGRMPAEGFPWLTGLQPAWDACAPTAMPSSRKSRKTS
jgi:5-methylcytosine-specific restriction endonuclease McrA